MLGGNGLATEQSYQLLRSAFDRVVDHRNVELGLRRQLLVGVLQPQPDRLRVLGAPPDEPALQLVDRGWREEHQQCLRHRTAYLAGALKIDLEQRGYPAT